MEETRSIIGYEEQYDITRSGRIIIKRNGKVRHKKGNEYGYTHVHLHKNGERNLFKTFELWEKAFSDANMNEYKGLK